MTKAAIYLRKSHKNKGVGKKVQRDGCTKAAKAEGWDVVKVYDEPQGYTGWDLDRPVWAQLVKDAKANKFSVVVAYEQSRVGRNPDVMAEVARQIRPLNIFFVVEGTELNAEPGTTGRLSYHLHNMMVEQEYATIKRRMAEGKAYKRKKGLIYPGTEPYGYYYTGNNHRFEIDPDTGPVVQRVFKMYLEGHSIKQIAATFTAEGAAGGRVSKEDRAKGIIPVPTTPPSISRILQNDIYVTGQMTRNQNKHKKRGNAAPVQLDDKGQPILKPQDDWQEYTMPPLISPDVWEAAQRKKNMNRNKSRRGQYGDPDKMVEFWLRDVMYCAHCDTKLKARRQQKKDKKTGEILKTYRYYTCHYSNCSRNELITAKRTKLCQLPNIQADDVHSELWDKVFSVLTFDMEPGSFGSIHLASVKKLGPVINSAEYDKKLEAIAKQIEAAKAERDGAQQQVIHLLKKMADPANDDEDSAYFRDSLTKAKARRSTAEAEITRLGVEYQEVADARDNDKLRAQLAEYGPVVLAQVAMKLHALGPADKKRLIDAMVDDYILIDGQRGGAGKRSSKWNIKAMDLKPGRALGVLNELRLEGKLDIELVTKADIYSSNGKSGESRIIGLLAGSDIIASD